MCDPCRKPAARPITGLEFTREEMESAARTGRLLSMELEMTRACNLRCTYCYSSAGSAADAELDLAEITDAVRQAAELGARKIIILGGGEPCVYPHLRELIDAIRARGLDIELFTNGTLIDDDLARFLHAHEVSVVVKRNANNADVQDDLAGVPGTYERIERGMRALQNAGYPDAAHGLGIQTVICRQNIGHVPGLWRSARSSGVHPYFETITPQGRACGNHSLDVSVNELKAVFTRLSEIDRDEFGIQWTPHPPLAGASCSRHLYSITLKSNGDLQPCVGVEIAVGNIRRDRIATVIRASTVIRDLRQVYTNIKGGCRTCHLNGACYGCRGAAFNLTGDYLASDPSCWLNGHDTIGKHSSERTHGPSHLG